MAEKKLLEVRDNKVPENINWAEVSEVQIFGWASKETHRKLVQTALREHRITIRCMDDEAQTSKDDTTSIDEQGDASKGWPA